MSTSIDLTSSVLDVGTIVDNLIYVDSAPVRNMQSQVSTLQSKMTAYQSLNTKISALSDKVSALLFGGGESPLSMPVSFNERFSGSVFAKSGVKSSDDTVISATAANATTGGDYSITVSSLAKAQTSLSSGFASPSSAAIGTGTLSITLGTTDPVTTSITIDSTNNTLNGLRDAINNTNSGVTATVINDGSADNPYKLLIRSNNTGLANSFTIDESGLSGGQALNIGAPTQSAADASFEMNGVSITKSSNTVSDVIDGVTFTLKQETLTPVTISVSKDIDSIVSAVQDFVTAYNSVASSINSQFTYNVSTQKAGLLAGDSTLRHIQNMLQSSLTQSVSNAFTSYAVASQVGLEFNRDGTVTLNESKFRKALTENFTGVAALFLGDGTNANQDASILADMYTALDGITDPLSGPIHNATDGLNRSIRALNDMIDSYQARLDKEKIMLTDEFNRADEALKLLKVNQASLTAQLSSLSST